MNIASASTPSRSTSSDRALVRTSVTVAPGDGIGPEIMEAVLFVLGEAGA